MNRSIYAIRDTVAQDIIGGLLVFPHDAPAIRFFSDACAEKGSILNQHPQDFELLDLGQLETSGEISNLHCPRLVITGAQWKAQQEAFNAQQQEAR